MSEATDVRPHSSAARRLQRRLSKGWPALVVIWVATAGAYWLGAQVGLSLALVDNQVTPLWPPTGIGLAALFLSRGRAWPGIALGAFIVNAPLGPTLLAAAAIAVGNTLAPVVAYRLMVWQHFHTQMARLRDTLLLVGLGALAAMTVSATVGATVLVAAGAVPAAGSLTVWWVWWAGDAMGVLVFAPILLLTLRRWQPGELRWRWLAEIVVVSTATLVMSILVFHSNLQVLFPIFPLIVWAALRRGQYGAAPAALITAVTATWFAAHGRGLFADLPVLRRMVLLLAINGVVAITAYLLAALTTERTSAREALQIAGAELEARVAERTAQLSATVAALEAADARAEQAQHLAAIGSWEWDVAADEVVWSEELYRLYGIDRPDRPMTYGDYLAAVHPEDADLVGQIVEQAYRSNGPFSVEHRVVHPDGSVHWIHGRGQVTCDSSGTPILMSGTAQDIDDRLAADEAARALEEMTERRRQALDLNDAIVQGIVAGQFALQLGQPERALQALDSTLVAARAMVTELWGEHTAGAGPAAGDLVRDIPAQLGQVRQQTAMDRQ